MAHSIERIRPEADLKELAAAIVGSRYPDRIALAISLNLRLRAIQAAHAKGVSLSEFVRQALEAQLPKLEPTR